MKLVDIADDLARAVDGLKFSPPVEHVYNPLVYAREPHVEYLSRYGNGSRRVVLVGMNPGPFGMAQTGVPFGDTVMVRDWLGIVGTVERPSSEHPKRPVLGFDCERREVSGTRLWGWARDSFGTPGRFFSRFFVVNYCPLVFLEKSGRNRTPDKLPAAERDALFEPCDLALRKTVLALGARLCIGVGAFARKRVEVSVAGLDVAVGQILHPSPASPLANKGWAERAAAQLAALGAK